MSYLRNWIRESRRDPQGLEERSELLEKLGTRMNGTSMEKGIGRLDMRGWLNFGDTTKLRKLLTSKCWTPAADEPLDGGCQDAAKHLIALLRAAEKRKCGVLLESTIRNLIQLAFHTSKHKGCCIVNYFPGALVSRVFFTSSSKPNSS